MNVRSSEAPPTATRDRILDAAGALFARQGFSGTAMREIAQSAGLTPASLYNHFSGKEALYEAVLERGVRPLIDLLRELSLREQSPDAAGEVIDALMAQLARTPELPRLIHHETAGGGERLTRLARHWIRPLVVQGLAEMKRDPHSVWEESEHAMVIAAWLHMVFGHFAMAPLLAEVFDTDPLSPEAIAGQTRFYRKLAQLWMGHGVPPPDPDQ